MAEVNLGRAALICAVATLFCTYQFMMQGAPSVMVPELVASLELDLTQVGFVASSFLYVYLILQVPGGMAADFFSLRKLLFVSCLVMAGAIYWFSVSETFLEASMARGLMGVATSPAIVVCMTLMARWFPDHWFPVLSGMVESFGMLGGALGPQLIPDLMEHFGWRGSMFYLAVAGAVLALAIVLIVKDRPDSDSEEEKPSRQEYNWSALLCNRNFWLCNIYGFGLFALINSFAALWGVPFLVERFPGHEQQVREAISLMFIGVAVGAPILGFIATITGSTRKVMIGSGVTACLLTSYCIFSHCTLNGMCITCFAIGFATGGYMLVFSMVRKLVPDNMVGIAMATSNGMMLLGGPLMQPLIGFVLNAQAGNGLGALDISHYQWAFSVIIVCQLLALLSIGLLRPTTQKAS